MNLSITFLYLQLQKHYETIRLHLPENKNVYCSSIHILPDSAWIPTSDTLYLTDLSVKELNKCVFPKESRFILSDDTLDEAPKYPCLIFPSSCSQSRILDDILSIFYRYENWNQRVTEAILKKESLQKILELTAEVQDNPMYFADKSFKMLASISRDLGEFSVIWRYQQKYGYLPLDVMLKLTQTEEISLLNNTGNAFYNVSKSFNRNFISKVIRDGSEPRGYFFIIEAYRYLNQCDIELAEHLGNLISSASHGSNNFLKNSRLYHEHFMIDILEGTLTDPFLTRHQLQALGWELHSEYSILGIPMAQDEEFQKRAVLVRLCDGWDAHGFLYQDMLLVVYHITGGSTSKLTAHLENLLKDLNKKGGLSETFSCFSHMSQYYRQIQAVLEKNNDSASALTLYKDYYLSHRSELIKKEIPIFLPVEKLKKYDVSHNCNYCETLYLYLLFEKNAVQTAKKLFLHRNTLKYRLEKIEEIIQVSLDDPMIRQRLLDSLYIILNFPNEKATNI